MRLLTSFFIIFIFYSNEARSVTSCTKKSFGEDSFVCVCNATYCDEFPEIQVRSGVFQLFSTSKNNPGITANSYRFAKTQDLNLNYVKINPLQSYQTVIGFGSGWSDASVANIKSLPNNTQDALLESLFGKKGMELTLCRVPIGSTPFSTRRYTQDDQPHDISLQFFKLQAEDIDRIDLLLRTLKVSQGEMKLFASAWSVPSWMLDNNAFLGIGFLKSELYQIWANFHIKFFEEYEKEGVSFWGLTSGNEPLRGYFSSGNASQSSAMVWTPQTMNKWIGKYLGPAIRNSKYRAFKLIIHDDSRLALPFWMPFLLNNEKTLQYADGIGVHFNNDNFSPNLLGFANSDQKDLFVVNTETCDAGFSATFQNIIGGNQGARLGSWKTAESYITNIFNDLKSNMSAWLDCNMVLDTKGGPSVTGNPADAIVIVNATEGVFYKQPTFYAFSHFSKFITSGSMRVGAQISVVGQIEGVQALAFRRPDEIHAVLIYNSRPFEMNINVEVMISPIETTTTTVHVSGNSINTMLFR